MKMTKQIGAITLILTVILLTAALLMITFSAQNSVLEQKSSNNQYSDNQSFAAAQAGAEFGLVYLNKNSATIIASPSNGYINYGAADANITNITLANNSKFSIVYTNPTQNNYTLIQITATGVSNDGTSTRSVKVQAYEVPNTFNSSAFSLGNVTFVGGSKLTNTITNANISTGGTVTINNGATTVTSSGNTSYQGHIGSDVEQNVAAYQGMNESTFFQTIFGTPEATVKSAAQAAGTYYSNAGPDYSQTLKGSTNETIFINQTNGSTVSLGQGVTIGSAANPVTLIVEGNLSIANGVTIYGFVYASGPSSGFTLAGGAVLYGGIASAGTMNISNGFLLTYNKFPVLAGTSAGTYSKVPGSWKDF